MFIERIISLYIAVFSKLDFKNFAVTGEVFVLVFSGVLIFSAYIIIFLDKKRTL